MNPMEVSNNTQHTTPATLEVIPQEPFVKEFVLSREGRGEQTGIQGFETGVPEYDIPEEELLLKSLGTINIDKITHLCKVTDEALPFGGEKVLLGDTVPGSTFPTPEEAYLVRERRKTIEDIFATVLDDSERFIVMERLGFTAPDGQEPPSYPEIAQKMGVTNGARPGIRATFRRAIKKLRVPTVKARLLDFLYVRLASDADEILGE